MKTRVAVGVVLVAAVLGGAALLWGANESGVVRREVGTPIAPTGGWITHSTATDRVQQIVVIDPSTQAMAVYHVDLASGRISLKSVRNVRYDLLMTEFNTDAPSPRELESLWKTP